MGAGSLPGMGEEDTGGGIQKEAGTERNKKKISTLHNIL